MPMTVQRNAVRNNTQHVRYISQDTDLTSDQEMEGLQSEGGDESEGQIRNQNLTLTRGRIVHSDLTDEDRLDALNETANETSSAEEEAGQTADAVDTISQEVFDFKQSVVASKTSRQITEADGTSFGQRADQIVTKVRNRQLTLEKAQGQLQNLKKELVNKIHETHASNEAERDSFKDKLKHAFDKVSRIQDRHNDLAFSRIGENAGAAVGDFAAGYAILGPLWALFQAGGQVDENNQHEWHARDKGVQIANALKGAIDTGDFSTAKSLLRRMDRKDARVVVQFVTGAIYEEFGKNEQDTIKALECLPVDFRQEMVSGALGDEKAIDRNERNASQQENEQRLFYFKAGEVADLINRSLAQENTNQYGYLSLDSSGSHLDSESDLLDNEETPTSDVSSNPSSDRTGLTDSTN